MGTRLVTRQSGRTASVTSGAESKQLNNNLFDRTFDEIFATAFSPPSEASQEGFFLSADDEVSLFCSLADLRETHHNDDEPKTTVKMFEMLGIENNRPNAPTNVSYKGPIGFHPSTDLYNLKSGGETSLDEPFDEWEDSIGDLWMEASVADSRVPTDCNAAAEEEGELIYARDVKYHRDRDFLNKYGWRRVISGSTSKVVYQHEEGRWPDQPSVKAARRAMRAFFDERREERRNPEVGKRRRGATEKAEEGEATEAASPRFAAPEVVKCVTVKPPPLPATPAADTPPLAAPAPDAGAHVGNSKRAKTTEYKAPLLASVITPSELKSPVTTFEEIDEDSMDKHERRKHKNWQAAATSRKRQQDHRKVLEDENRKRQEENAYLRKLLAEHMRGQKADVTADPNGTGTTLGDPIEMLAFA